MLIRGAIGSLIEERLRSRLERGFFAEEEGLFWEEAGFEFEPAGTTFAAEEGAGWDSRGN